MDAINEFKGDWPYEQVAMISCTRSYSYYGIGCFESYSCGKFSDLNDASWGKVCTREQFNALVSECETNFGTSLTIADYKKQQENNVIDWSKAPEGATHYGCENDSYGAGWYKNINNNTFDVWPVTHGKWHTSVGKGGDIGDRELIPKPQHKPIYTQAMSDAGELPCVGMECMAKLKHQSYDHWGKVYIIGHSQDGKWLVFSDAFNTLSQHHIDNGTYEFKPIDTRTDKEKAFDKFLDDNYNCKISDFKSSQSDKDFIEGLQLAFDSGVTFTGEL